MTQPEVFWTGASGKKYGYWSKSLPYHCDPDQNGNYIFAKPAIGGWTPVYVGQGDLNERVNDPEHYQCAISKGATHVHVHTTATLAARIAEEADLLAGHPEAYAPTGCNQKIGG